MTMFPRRPLRLPITLAIAMIVMIVALSIGWVLLAVGGALTRPNQSGVYWVVLSIGTTLFVLVLVGVVLYLTLSIKAINLSRRQSNFIDSVTHELKSPIASLKLYLQTLRRRPVSEKEQGEFYQWMLEDVERLDDLINHLLDAARLDKSSEDRRQQIDLAFLLRECAAAVCLRHRCSPSIIDLDLHPALVQAQPVDVDLIFRNVLDNAIKYAGVPPRIQVRMRPVGEGRVLTRIIDNGEGIPRERRRKIFGRFVRLGAELERNKPGTGLGLYIVRTLVRTLKGTIRVTDPEEGSGTVFEIMLPGHAPNKIKHGPESNQRPQQPYDASFEQHGVSSSIDSPVEPKPTIGSKIRSASTNPR